MSTKNNPGLHHCFEKALPDEPLFTLLGRDVTAPFVVLIWAKMRELMYGETEQTSEALTCAAEMKVWADKLGKSDKLEIAHQAFLRACFEVAKAALEEKQSAPPQPNPGAGI